MMQNTLLLAMAPAQGGGNGQSGDLMSTIMLIVPMILIFYFFIIRPQSKRAKEHHTFLESLKRGDKVITTGGIWGKIAAINDNENYVDVLIARDTTVRMNKSTIAMYQQGHSGQDEDN